MATSCLGYSKLILIFVQLYKTFLMFSRMEKKLWKDFPEVIASQRINFVPLDFFKESPVKDCDFYYMRHVLHDWSDAESVKILEGIRKVMNAGSKLLIQEFAVPQLVRSSTSLNKQAPEPLLPNYGIGRVITYSADIHMLNLANAKERTVIEFEALATTSGFKLNKITEAGEMSIIEFVPI